MKGRQDKRELNWAKRFRLRVWHEQKTKKIPPQQKQQSHEASKNRQIRNGKKGKNIGVGVYIWGRGQVTDRKLRTKEQWRETEVRAVGLKQQGVCVGSEHQEVKPETP